MGSVDWRRMPVPKYRSGGIYYVCAEGTGSSQSPVANTLYTGRPIELWQPTLDIAGMGIEVLIAESGTTLKLSLWEEEFTEGGFPGKLVYEASSTGMSGTTTGRKDNTFLTPLRLSGPALFYPAVCVQGGVGTLEITMTSGYTPWTPGKYSDLTNTFSGGFKAETTTPGAMPASFPLPPSSSRTSKIYFWTK